MFFGWAKLGFMNFFKLLSYIFIALFRDTPLATIGRTWPDGHMAKNGQNGHLWPSGHLAIGDQ